MRLLPGDQVTETEVAAYFKVSRTPVREALQRLQSDGLMQGYVRGGWEVVPMDFKGFADLYELRELIEVRAVTRLGASRGGGKRSIDMAPINALQADWCIPPEQRLTHSRAVAALDECSHQTLVRATGNQ